MVSEVEAWSIFANVIAGPASTIAAAIISGAAAVATTSIMASVIKEALKETTAEQIKTQEILRQMSKTKFF